MSDLNINGAYKWFFDENYIASYYEAIYELYEMIELLEDDGFYTKIIPSRGVYMFYEFAKKISIMNIQYNHNISKQDKRRKRLNLQHIVVLPFSSDPSGSQTSEAIRRYWVKVLLALTNKDFTSPHLKFYKFLVEKVAKATWNNIDYEIKNNKFIFIDTVVSGRAICEIIQSFEEEKFENFYLILFIDERGDKLKKDYKLKLEQYEKNNKCTLIYVEKLYTEDKGPGTSGLWVRIYPQLIEYLQKKYTWAADAYGAATHYFKVSHNQRLGVFEGKADENKPFQALYSVFSEQVFCYIATKFMEKISISMQKDKNIKENVALDNHKYLQELAPTGTALDRNLTKKFALTREESIHGKNINVEVTSSHLIRVKFKKGRLKKLIEIYEKKYRDQDCFDE